ncbi:hypothetical protein LSH36_176g04035 [Paralvinella palmiformis]|uniref:G-protein coupled receptors family 1 profile domain-containing protein n=1 Tax=Paralvinella palmiformis TaxID=53620 RepID=A0AAD9N5T6_9ANNE|nr:hypothetical protein LSH36_176g04035 [Paralvinella palmiformis]
MNLRDTLSDHVTSFLSSLHPGIATGSSNLANAGNRPSVATSSGANHCEILTDLEWTTSWSRDDEETASDKSRVHDRDGSVLRQSVNGSDRHLYGADSQAYDRADIRSTYYDVFDWVSGSAATRRGGHVTDGRDDADSRLVPEAARADSDTASIEHPERRTSAISSVARSKRTLGAMIAVSSTSGHPVYGLPVSSGQSSSRIHRDSLDDRSTNRTASLTDYVSETIHNAFGANDSHGAEHVQSGSFERPNQDGVASVLPSSASRLANGDDWRAGGRTALDQSSSPFEFGQSRAPSVLTSRPDDVTGLAETGTSVSSTPFPGYVNVNNISFDGLLDHYLGNFTSPCIDWTTNGTCLYGNGTAMNATVTWSDGGDVIAPPIRLWTLFLLIFPLFTVFGNILVVMSVYKEKSLRTVTNYFIVSLAIADIMVAVLVMPLAVYVEDSLRLKSIEFEYVIVRGLRQTLFLGSPYLGYEAVVVPSLIVPGTPPNGSIRETLEPARAVDRISGIPSSPVGDINGLHRVEGDNMVITSSANNQARLCRPPSWITLDNHVMYNRPIGTFIDKPGVRDASRRPDGYLRIIESGRLERSGTNRSSALATREGSF